MLNFPSSYKRDKQLIRKLNPNKTYNLGQGLSPSAANDLVLADTREELEEMLADHVIINHYNNT